MRSSRSFFFVVKTRMLVLTLVSVWIRLSLCTGMWESAAESPHVSVWIELPRSCTDTCGQLHHLTVFVFEERCCTLAGGLCHAFQEEFVMHFRKKLFV